MVLTSIPTLSFESFDVNSRTGFMPCQPPLGRLPAAWETWEVLLDDARRYQLQPGDKWGLSSMDKTCSEQWRFCLSQIPLLSTDALSTSIVLLRRAHLVLTFLLHFYIHTLPPDVPVVIPRSISIPILQVAKALDLPPVITLSDTVLYNWYSCQSNYNSTAESEFASSSLLDNIRCQTLFTNLPDEAAFYLCSARIELRGADALAIMRSCMDELNNVSTFGTFGDNDHHSLDLDAIVTRLVTYLYSLSSIIDDLKSLLLDVRKGCDPEVYYTAVRPWFRGEDSETYSTSQSEEEPGNKHKRKWIFEGAGEHADLNMLPPDRELSGASAGQSSLVHALDIFFGVNHEQHEHGHPNPPPSFMKRMQRYMPRQHRTFLDHLGKSMNLRSLRRFVLSFSASYAEGSENGQRVELQEAYNKAVMSLKEFRDAHMIIATLYIIGPSRRARAAEATTAAARGNYGLAPVYTNSDTSTTRMPVSDTTMTATPSKSDTGVMKVAKSIPAINSERVVKGTGGTDLVRFLKDVRNQTFRTLLTSQEPTSILPLVL